MPFRRWKACGTPALVALLAISSCQPRPDRLASSVERELARGNAAARAWLDSTSSSAALSHAYVERAHYGLGSPFRLIDYALQDPRLDETARQRVAWAVLDRVVRGETYFVDPIVLRENRFQLIANAVLQAAEPRAAELGVRLGFSLAQQDSLVSETEVRVAAGVAALLVDRVLARRDGMQLLQRSNAVAAVAKWRRERRFLVERPRLASLMPEYYAEAQGVAARIVQELRILNMVRLEHERAAPVARATEPADAAFEVLLHRFDYPAQTPIVVVARNHVRTTGEHGRLVTRARNEESFLAEYRRLSRRAPNDRAVALMALQAAVSLRSYAQERVWFPGMAGPGTRELESLYGITVVFDESVPARWRPYYRQMLGSALQDLYRVLPATKLKGLRVRFGPAAAGSDILAMHEPRRRRLLLPPATSAGTIAHELAHDIDWQEAVAKYRVHGDYATDIASRRQDDRFARRVRALTTAALAGMNPLERTRHARRPAEVFARSVDWYVAVALAAQGRSNGYLTSVQDDLITGYGTVRAPDVSGQAGDALLDVLNDLAPIYREQRDLFRALYGTTRAPTAYDVVLGGTAPRAACGAFELLSSRAACGIELR